MAKVKFKTNLGSIVAERLGLKVNDCLLGSVAEVSEAEAAELAVFEHAEIIPTPKPVVAEAKPVEVKAVPPVAVTSQQKPVEKPVPSAPLAKSPNNKK